MENQKKSPSCSKAFIIIVAVLGILGIAVMIAVAMLVLRIPGIDRSERTVNDGSLMAEQATKPNIEDPTSANTQDERVVILNESDSETLESIENEDIPVNDPIELARRVGGLSYTPAFKAEMPGVRSVGEIEPFWILDVDTNEYRQADSRLVYITPHLYLWAEEGIEVDGQAAADLAETFEYEIYPTTREIFGSEWTPGVDHDDRLTILYASGLGSAAGYFSSTDSLTAEIETYSNETEMFYVSADHTRLDSLYTIGVLAHEFQHMIHWNIDRNESSWINEGLSELAVELNGYDTGSFSLFFSLDPDLQLNFWPGNDQGDSTPHYGASYLFMKYLMDRFGLDSISELVANKEVGLVSIDEVYRSMSLELGQGFTAEKIFQDWSIANFTTGSGLPLTDLGYEDHESIPAFFPTETLSCDSGWQTRTVSQFGSDYIAVDCTGEFRIEIEGEGKVQLLPAEPYSGDHYFWSNYGDSSNMTLTQTFDLRNVQGDIAFEYWVWYDIESDYDYLYLLASTDGENWDLLAPDGCTVEDPTGSNYGCGYNGRSDGWINVSVDLSAYAGSQVTLQFEYITDLAVNGDGFLIDNAAIEAINYFSDFESDDGGWDGQGFVRVKNTLPQNFGYAYLPMSSGDNNKIISIGGLQIDQKIDLLEQDLNPVIVINGLTRVSRIPADYRVRISSVK